ARVDGPGRFGLVIDGGGGAEGVLLEVGGGAREGDALADAVGGDAHELEFGEVEVPVVGAAGAAVGEGGVGQELEADGGDAREFCATVDEVRVFVGAFAGGADGAV